MEILSGLVMAAAVGLLLGWLIYWATRVLYFCIVTVVYVVRSIWDRFSV